MATTSGLMPCRTMSRATVATTPTQRIFHIRLLRPRNPVAEPKALYAICDNIFS